MPQQTYINLANKNGHLIFDAVSNLSILSSNINIQSSNNTNISSNNLEISSNELKIKSIKSPLEIVSSNNTDKSILLNASHQDGGITSNVNKGGFTVNSTGGNISLNASNASINLGYIGDESDENLTKSINLESLEKISMNTEDFYLISSDSIHFLSQTGNINFGSQIGESFIKFEDYNLLLNKNSSKLNRQLDIQTDKTSSTKGYNGISLNSTNSEVSSDIILDNKLQLGFENESNRSAVKYILNGYQEGNKLYVVDSSPVNYYEIINTTIVWATVEGDFNDPANQNAETDIITNITTSYNNLDTNSDYQIRFSTSNGNCNHVVETLPIYKATIIEFVTDANDPTKYTLTIECQSSKSRGKECHVLENTNILELNDNKGTTIEFYQEYISSGGYKTGDYWIFEQQYVFEMEKTQTISSRQFHIIDSNVGFIRTSDSSDFKIGTSNMTQLKISPDNGLTLLGSDYPSPNTLVVSNNGMKDRHISKNITVKQSNQCVISISRGGYIIIREEEDPLISNSSNSSNSNIIGTYFDCCMNSSPSCFEDVKINYDNDSTSQSNNTLFSNQSPCAAANTTINSTEFIVAWYKKSAEATIYEIVFQIFDNFKPKKMFNIPLDNIYNSSETGLELDIKYIDNNNYFITWTGNREDSSINNVYGIIVDSFGNGLTDILQINNDGGQDENTQGDVQLRSYLKPQLFAMSENRVGVMYHNQTNVSSQILESNSNLSNDNILYETRYSILNWDRQSLVCVQQNKKMVYGNSQHLLRAPNVCSNGFTNYLTYYNYKVNKPVIALLQSDEDSLLCLEIPHYLNNFYLDVSTDKNNKSSGNNDFLSDIILVNVCDTYKYVGFTTNSHIHIKLFNKEGVVDSYRSCINYRESGGVSVQDFSFINIYGKHHKYGGVICSWNIDNTIKHSLFNYHCSLVRFGNKENNGVLDFKRNGSLHIGRYLSESTSNKNDNSNIINYCSSTLDIEGSVSSSIRTVNTLEYRLSKYDYTILVDGQKNNVIVYLNYEKYNLKNGLKYTIKRIDRNYDNTVTVTDSQNIENMKNMENNILIDGQEKYCLTKQYDHITVQYYNKNWYIIS